MNLPVTTQFERAAATYPNKVAVRFQNQQLTYQELDQQANQLANLLAARGVGPGVIVGVLLGPSIDVLRSLLAIFKLGGIYLPLDPTHPPRLIHDMVSEAKPRLVLNHRKGQHLAASVDAIPLDDAPWGLEPTTKPAVSLHLDQPSHLVYTSGTTGKPKGVLNLQRNLQHYIEVARDRYGFTAEDRFASGARFTFSISMFELMSPLTVGASLELLAREEILDLNRLAVKLQDFTVIHFGPSLLGSLFRHLAQNSELPQSYPSMRHASSGGDIVPPTVLERMKQVFPTAELFVIYGSSEISCMGCTWPVPRNETITVTRVGRPFPNVWVKVVDESGNEVEPGTKGEIWFAGRGVVPGYFQRPELNAEKFRDLDGLRFYTMGDVGRFLPDGDLEMLGRKDYQVQIRGMRVELVGIEAAVCNLGLAASCAITVKQVSDDDVRLVAFVINPRSDLTIADFRKEVGSVLPDYMVPQHMIAVDKFPLTHNGKLDRNQLATLPWEVSREGGEAPRTELEVQLAKIMGEVLGVPAVTLDDDFFNLGGHSLLAVIFMDRIKKQLGLDVSPFEHSTVRAIAERKDGDTHPVLISKDSTKPALFMLTGVHLYRELAKHLEGRYSVYGVYSPKELAAFESGNPSVVELARDQVAIIRRQQPHGPYRLGGMSFGGIVAYEAAQQLMAAGEQVDFLGLLDSVLPETDAAKLYYRAKKLASMSSKELMAWMRKRVRVRFLGEKDFRTSLVRHTDDPILLRKEEIRQDIYRAAATQYIKRIQKFSGPLALVVAGQRLEGDHYANPHCGWNRHAEKVHWHSVNTNHIGLIDNPNVAEVANYFLSLLDNGHERKV